MHHTNIPLKTNFGGWGVSIFLVLSGFLMSYSYNNRDLPSTIKDCCRFSIKKIKKLYPLHLLTLITALVLVLYAEIRYFDIKHFILSVLEFIANFTLLQSWLPFKSFYFSYNGVSWYLSVCLFIYFAFPFILNTLRKTNNRRRVFYILGIYVIQMLFSILVSIIKMPIGILEFDKNFAEWFTYIFPVFRLGDFTIGCIIGCLFIDNNVKNKITTQKKATFCEFIAIVILLFSLYLSRFANSGSLFFAFLNSTILFLPSSALFVFSLALEKGRVSKLLKNKFFIGLGNISAYTFLIHQMVIRYFMRAESIFGIIINYWVESLILLIAILVIAKFVKFATTKK